MQVAKTVLFEASPPTLITPEDINISPTLYERWAMAAKRARFIKYEKSDSHQANAERFISSLLDPQLARFKATNHRLNLDIYRQIRSILLSRMLSVKPDPDGGLAAGLKKLLGNEINPGMLQHGRLSQIGKDAVNGWIRQIFRDLQSK